MRIFLSVAIATLDDVYGKQSDEMHSPWQRSDICVICDISACHVTWALADPPTNLPFIACLV